MSVKVRWQLREEEELPPLFTTTPPGRRRGAPYPVGPFRPECRPATCREGEDAAVPGRRRGPPLFFTEPPGRRREVSVSFWVLGTLWSVTTTGRRSRCHLGPGLREEEEHRVNSYLP
jgi:hypothetical protein